MNQQFMHAFLALQRPDAQSQGKAEIAAYQYGNYCGSRNFDPTYRSEACNDIDRGCKGLKLCLDDVCGNDGVYKCVAKNKEAVCDCKIGLLKDLLDDDASRQYCIDNEEWGCESTKCPFDEFKALNIIGHSVWVFLAGCDIPDDEVKTKVCSTLFPGFPDVGNTICGPDVLEYCVGFCI